MPRSNRCQTFLLKRRFQGLTAHISDQTKVQFVLNVFPGVGIFGASEVPFQQTSIERHILLGHEV